MISSSTLHMKAESSTTSTRIFLSGVLVISTLPYRDADCGPSMRRLRADELLHGFNQLIFLHRLGQEPRRAFLHGAIAMFGSGAGRHYEHGNLARSGILPQMGHQLVAIHARHLEVGDDEMAANLGDDLGRFQAIGRELDAVAGLFEHAAYEFP